MAKLVNFMNDISFTTSKPTGKSVVNGRENGRVNKSFEGVYSTNIWNPSEITLET